MRLFWAVFSHCVCSTTIACYVVVDVYILMHDAFVSHII